MYNSALIKKIFKIMVIICGIAPLILYIIFWGGVFSQKIRGITGIIPAIGILYISTIAIIIAFLSKKILPRKLSKTLIITNIVIAIMNLIPLLYLRVGPYLLGP